MGWNCVAVTAAGRLRHPLIARELWTPLRDWCRRQTAAPLLWRRDAQAERQARANAESMLADGLTLDEAISGGLPRKPGLQLALEQLEISRSQFVAAAPAAQSRCASSASASLVEISRLSIPAAMSPWVCCRISIDLLNMPDRRAVARRDLEPGAV